MPDDVQDPNAEVMQVPMKMVTVPVAVEGVVPVKTVPAIGGTEFVQFVLASGGVAQRVLNKDPQRRQATLISTDQPFYVGSSQSQAANVSTAVLWPKLVPLVITGTNEVWAYAGTANQSTALMVVTEREY